VINMIEILQCDASSKDTGSKDASSKDTINMIETL
jgi:hypothetical protein